MNPRDRGFFLYPGAYVGPANPEAQIGFYQGWRDVLAYYQDHGFLDAEGNHNGKLEQAVINWINTGEMDELLEQVPLIGMGGFFVERK
jgi:hypothetical protein